jgi:hypothetical protein
MIATECDPLISLPISPKESARWAALSPRYPLAAAAGTRSGTVIGLGRFTDTVEAIPA